MIVFEFPAHPRAQPGDLWYAHRLRFDPPRGRLLAWVETIRRERYSYARYIGRAFGAFDLATGHWQQLLPHAIDDNGLTLFSPAVSPDGEIIATGAFRQLHEYQLDQAAYRVKLLRADGQTREVRTRVSRGVAALEFTPTGRFLYGIENRDLRPDSTPSSRSYLSALARCNVEALFARPVAPEPSEWEILCDLPRGANGCRLAFTPDAKYLAVGRTDGHVTLLHTHVHSNTATFARDSDRQAMVPRVEELAVSPDGSRLAVVSNEYIALWNLVERARVWRSEGGRWAASPVTAGWNIEGPVGRAIAFAPDGRTFATGADDGIVWWHDYTGAPFRDFRWNVGEIHALTFAPDGLTCAASGLNGKVVIWDVD